jgi:hypothetical protein
MLQFNNEGWLNGASQRKFNQRDQSVTKTSKQAVLDVIDLIYERLK